MAEINLSERLDSNSGHKVQNCQTKVFLSLLTTRYDKVLDEECGKGNFSYIGAIKGKFKDEIVLSSVQIVPCWYGFMGPNIGLDSLPLVFSNICQFFCKS